MKSPLSKCCTPMSFKAIKFRSSFKRFQHADSRVCEKKMWPYKFFQNMKVHFSLIHLRYIRSTASLSNNEKKYFWTLFFNLIFPKPENIYLVKMVKSKKLSFHSKLNCYLMTMIQKTWFLKKVWQCNMQNLKYKINVLVILYGKCLQWDIVVSLLK